MRFVVEDHDVGHLSQKTVLLGLGEEQLDQLLLFWLQFIIASFMHQVLVCMGYNI